MDREALIDVALGNTPADLVIRGGKLVDVHTEQIYPADVALKGERIACVGEVGHTIGPDTLIVDAIGKYLTPGLIDTHQHSYEAHLNMTEYARVLLLHGTTAVCEAFYGMGIVSGMQGVTFCLEELKSTPLKVIFLAPALAYLQNRELGLPPTPSSPTFEDIKRALDWPECRGVEEPPYYPVLEKDPLFLDLFENALVKGKVITGHACGLRGKGLNAYVLMGAASDHECVSAEEAVEKTRLGCRISVREGSGASDVLQVVGALTEHRVDPRYFTFCGDEVEFLRLYKSGHLDYNIRLAVSAGVNPVTAVQMATINAAELLRVDRELGSVVPGKVADILLVDDLRQFGVSCVIANGRIVVRDGQFVTTWPRPEYPDWMYGTVRLKRRLSVEDFTVYAPPATREVTVRVIGVTDGALLSDERHLRVEVKQGRVEPDLRQDILKFAMVDRYDRWEKVAVGFIQGFGLKDGAIGSTYNPLYENILLVGTNDWDMLVAANRVAELGGGFVAVRNGQVVGQLELPLFGLLYDGSLESATRKMESLYRAVRDMGCRLRTGPFHTLAFMAVCGEIGHLKLGHEGLFDVDRRCFVSTLVP